MDKMTPIPFESLMLWARKERRIHGSVFGVRKEFKKTDDKILGIFGQKLELPFGPAAGPHTQLAQNIIAAYMAGCRFFELKTVQIMDGEELSKCVAKPCILSNDECYNCEWSTELTVPDAFNEYVKAYFAIKLLSREWGLGSPDGFVFNMSVGYDLEGIKSEKVDTFIRSMGDASKTPIFRACMDYALANVSNMPSWNKESIRAISPAICSSITLSTLHGCPPDEIERISTYLLEEKCLHTFVKCNPTLLGYEFCRTTLDSMGYDYMSFDEHHFNEDLQYEDAIPMFKRLQAIADLKGLTFGVKLTNTFPVEVTNKELPSDEMYMSGRPLFALTTALALRLSKEFDGKLRISYSGGADYFNIVDLFNCGIWPITLASTLLKPGGYERCVQLAESLSRHTFSGFYGVSVNKLSTLVADARASVRYKKAIKPLPRRKLDETVPLFTCFTAPCTHGCPINQDIPEYVELVGKGKNREALRVIISKNPMPFTTGTICPHHCTDKCTRNFYEEPIRIRDAKLEAARNAFDMVIGEIMAPAKTKSYRVAIIGGGPAGISAAYFLGREGVAVTLFEKRESLGGIVRHVIPRFRIRDYAIEQDVQLMEKMGVDVKLGAPAPRISELKEAGFDYILMATGAWKHGKVPLEGEQLNVIEFLEQYKKNEDSVHLGKNVVVIGGGNTAMDAARAAKRVKGVEKVSLVYRRTKKYMPADEEELALAIADGVEFCELLAPKTLADGMLSCNRMELGAPDKSGRRRPVETSQITQIPADTVIAAVGEGIDGELFGANGIDLDAKGKVAYNESTYETNLPGVYVLGDARRGPATVVEAIADATAVTSLIMGESRQFEMPQSALVAPEVAKAKRGILCHAGHTGCESQRCLDCSTVCECCVDVCPNRANVAIDLPDGAQILHIDRMCNECGNCEVFCPYASAPYKAKFTLFHTKEDMDASENEGFMVLDSATRRVKVRLGGSVIETCLTDEETGLDKAVEHLIWCVFTSYKYLL